MELHCSNVVQVTLQGEHALLGLVVPHLDQVVVTSGHKHWLRIMEANSSDRSIVIFEFVEQDLRSVIEQMNASIV